MYVIDLFLFRYCQHFWQEDFVHWSDWWTYLTPKVGVRISCHYPLSQFKIFKIQVHHFHFGYLAHPYFQHSLFSISQFRQYQVAKLAKQPDENIQFLITNLFNFFIFLFPNVDKSKRVEKDKIIGLREKTCQLRLR